MDWRHRAACRRMDPELFFQVGTSGPALQQSADAKAVCAGCPVRAQCLDWALRTGQDFGVWGGTSEDERRALRRRAGRADRDRTSSPSRPTGSSRMPCQHWFSWIDPEVGIAYCQDCPHAWAIQRPPAHPAGRYPARRDPHHNHPGPGPRATRHRVPPEGTDTS